MRFDGRCMEYQPGLEVLVEVPVAGSAQTSFGRMIRAMERRISGRIPSKLSCAVELQERRMNSTIRADQVGSFLRPADLLAARQAGTDPARLRALEDTHIRRVFARQQELGLDVYTDGEFRRRHFMSDP